MDPKESPVQIKQRLDDEWRVVFLSHNGRLSLDREGSHVSVEQEKGTRQWVVRDDPEQPGQPMDDEHLYETVLRKPISTLLARETDNFSVSVPSRETFLSVGCLDSKGHGWKNISIRTAEGVWNFASPAELKGWLWNRFPILRDSGFA